MYLRLSKIRQNNLKIKIFSLSFKNPKMTLFLPMYQFTNKTVAVLRLLCLTLTVSALLCSAGSVLT
jgi:hypothetical protein